VKKVSRSRGGNFLVFAIVFVFGALFFFPFLYAVLQSFKPMSEIFAFPPRFFVENPTPENYLQIASLTGNLWVPFGRYLFNSVFITVLGTVGHILIVSAAAFPLAKFTFPGSKLYFEIIVLSLLFTPSVTQIPQYVIMAKAGMIDTYWVMLLPPLAGSFGLFLMKQFMSVLPDAIIEAASIDGAGKMRIFISIIMPNVRPAWLTLMIFVFQTYWSGTGSSYIYEESLKPLPAILTQIASAGIARAGAGAAVTILLSLPPILLFLFAQRRIVETMAYSGIKD